MMWEKIKKVVSLIGKHGLSETIYRLIDYAYLSYFRGRVPYRNTRFHGVKVPANKIGDQYFSVELFVDRPLYETALGSAISRRVSPGDAVIIVGAGWGVSSVLAAQAADERGTVEAYEASEEFADKIEKTLQLNPVPANVNVRGQAVGSVKNLYGDEEKGVEQTLDPTELEKCDVLVLDCEGAEISILQRMEIEPHTIIVESHGLYNSPTAEVREELIDRGYDITEEHPAEFGAPHYDDCVNNDVYVLTGTRDERE